MNKKTIIILSAAILLLTGFSLIYFLELKRDKPPAVPSRVVIARPEYESGNLSWMTELIQQFSPHGEEPYAVEKLVVEQEYSYYLEERIAMEATEDLFYSVNTVQQQSYLNRSWLSPIPEELWNDQPAAFETLLERDDTSYYYPISWYGWGLYYNQDLWTEKGWQIPETWSEFLLLCDSIKGSGIPPIVISRSEMWVGTLWFEYLNLRINGAEFHKRLMAGEIPWTSQELDEVFTELRKIQVYLAEIPSQTLWEDGAMLMESNQAAMMLSGRFFQLYWQKNLPGDLAWFSFPEVNPAIERTELISSAGMLIGTENFNQEETRQFLSYLQSTEAADIVAQGSSSMAVASPEWWQGQQGIDKEIYENLQRAESAMPVMDRNGHPSLLLPVKLAIRRTLFTEDPLDEIRNDLESERLALPE